MTVGWVKNFLLRIVPGGLERPADGIGQGAQAFEKKARRRLADLIDVTDGLFLAQEAHRQSEELTTIIRRGGNHLDRLRLWFSARRKVKKNIADFYDIPEVLDEVTEKMTEAAENDPLYRHWLR